MDEMEMRSVLETMGRKARRASAALAVLPSEAKNTIMG